MKNTVGSIVESICGKCKDVMGHAIVSMVGDTIAKVECRVCGSVHQYRPPTKITSGKTVTLKRGRDGAPVTSRETKPDTARSVAPRKTTRKPDAATLAREQWLTMAHNREGENARPYAMKESFAVKELVDHPTFGLGEVQAVIPPDKIDILFAEGIKRLLHNKK